MIDEREEFDAYTGPVVYDAQNKQDSAYLGRFTFDTLLKGEGLQRILTILARGYLWQAGKPDLDCARDALRAWCSIPDSKNAKPKEAWQYGTDFRQLHGAFPELVDEQGNGWFVRHVHGVRDFLKRHPEKVSKPAPTAGTHTGEAGCGSSRCPSFPQRPKAAGCCASTTSWRTPWS